MWRLNTAEIAGPALEDWRPPDYHPFINNYNLHERERTTLPVKPATCDSSEPEVTHDWYGVKSRWTTASSASHNFCCLKRQSSSAASDTIFLQLQTAICYFKWDITLWWIHEEVNTAVSHN